MATNYHEVHGLNLAVDTNYPTFDDAIISEIRINKKIKNYNRSDMVNQSDKYKSFRSPEESKYGPEVVNNMVNKSLDVYGYESRGRGSLRNINLYDNIY